MSGQVTVETLLAELSALTNLSPGDWRDFLDCTPSQQLLIAQGYRDMVWTKSPSTFAKVLEVLGVIGTIAGVVSGVSGAVTGVIALKAALT